VGEPGVVVQSHFRSHSASVAPQIKPPTRWATSPRTTPVTCCSRRHQVSAARTPHPRSGRSTRPCRDEAGLGDSWVKHVPDGQTSAPVAAY